MFLTAAMFVVPLLSVLLSCRGLCASTRGGVGSVLSERSTCFCPGTVEPRFNEVAGSRPNLFVKWRVRYIESLDVTNLRGNDQNVRYIEVIVNDWFATQVTSITLFNAVFVTKKCRVLRCNSLLKHGGFQYQLFSLLSRRAAFVYCAKEWYP